MEPDGREPSVLLGFAHPALERSRANAVLAEAGKQAAGVRFHDLYEVYPDFVIDEIGRAHV